ncbi:unnamed protein product [Trichogramma brassicae]|uniref:CCHC-type domain-containing protein n=1 Tax=Trichogramma brassicae TaxID=86971 RepID=A0A6H5ITD6_9HYME|nr:unnamed protein product [Trichogramma brassicae]
MVSATTTPVKEKKTKNVKVKVSWVYELSKDQLVQELATRKVEVSESEKIDELRKKLVKVIRENAKNDTKSESSEDSEEVFSECKSVTEMQTETPKLEFVLDKDNWDIFVERLEIIFLAKDTKDDKKAAIMLTRFDEDAYKLAKHLCAPGKPADKEYKDLVTIMSNHLAPKPSEVMERCKFNTARQEAQESVSEFAARLKKLSLHCNYTDLPTACRDQFVCGIRDHETRVTLFQIKDLTFDKALTTAQARESAVKNALQSVQALEGKSTNAELFKFHAHKINKGAHQRPNRNDNSKSQESKCYRCGISNHKPSDCKYKDFECNYCHKKGHLQRACRVRAGKTDVKYMQERDDDDDGEFDNKIIEQRDNEIATTEEDFYLNDFYVLRKGARCEPDSESGAKPMFIDVRINGNQIPMELDTGTYYSVISETFRLRHFPALKMEPTSHALRGEITTPRLAHDGTRGAGSDTSEPAQGAHCTLNKHTYTIKHNPRLPTYTTTYYERETSTSPPRSNRAGKYRQARMLKTAGNWSAVSSFAQSVRLQTEARGARGEHIYVFTWKDSRKTLLRDAILPNLDPSFCVEHTLLASPPELSIRTRCPVPSCECGSRFRRHHASTRKPRLSNPAPYYAIPKLIPTQARPVCRIIFYLTAIARNISTCSPGKTREKRY